MQRKEKLKEQKNMEIERRFMVAQFPNAAVLKRTYMEQGYLAVGEIEVRVRKSVANHQISYTLCFKSEGTLARKEVEFEIDQARYEALVALLKGELITKEHRVYALDSHALEVSLVDEGLPHAFYYAEIEFASEEEALAFEEEQIPHVLKEVTFDTSYNMKNHWQRTRS